MSTQGLGFFDTGEPVPDLMIENGQLKFDNTLQTPSMISVYSDKRVESEDLPEGLEESRGWWADALADEADDKIGSRLWTLPRAGKIVDSTVNELESYLYESFTWMISDGIASGITVEAERNGQEEIRGRVEITKPSGGVVPFKFIWDGQELELIGG